MSTINRLKHLNRRQALALLGSAGPAIATAQESWAPSKPMALAVPFSPGGPTDAIARTLAERLGKLLGQPMVVENRPGAGGAIAYEHVARAAPDGHTFGIVGSSMIANAALGILPIDPLRSFTPVAQLLNLETLLVTRPEVPAQTVPELIAYLKRNPGRLNYGSSGNGSLTHLQMEVFKALTGTHIVHIPYRGSAGTVTDLLGGQIQMSFDTIATFGPHIKSGALRLLATAMPVRSQSFPATPTVAESDGLLRDFDVVVWTGFAGPANLPRQVVTRVYQELEKVLKEEAVLQRLQAAGAIAALAPPDAFTKRMVDESARMTQLIKRLNLKAG